MKQKLIILIIAILRLLKILLKKCLLLLVLNNKMKLIQVGIWLDALRKSYKNDIKNTVFNKSEIARYTAHCVNIRQNDSNGDNHTVPVNIKSENTETAAIRNFHTTEQIGKRHRHISQSFRRSEHQ